MNQWRDFEPQLSAKVNLHHWQSTNWIVPLRNVAYLHSVLCSVFWFISVIKVSRVMLEVITGYACY